MQHAKLQVTKRKHRQKRVRSSRNNYNRLVYLLFNVVQQLTMSFPDRCFKSSKLTANMIKSTGLWTDE